MATDYQTLYNTLLADVGNHPLWRQAYVAVLKAAADIRNEDSETSNHPNRLTWANEVASNPAAMVRKMKCRIMENSTLAAAPTEATDSDVQYVINLLIDTFATGE
jgi:hypothetical protein